MQLSSRIRSRDLEDFFSVVGKVNDVRIITDTKTRRSKGIAYVEFCDVESVPLVSCVCPKCLSIINVFILEI
ncbi:putative RNA-binding protein 23 [Portunus trituberculatus]|uniref:Putative RNA-binding protein 23 n=1 Tax=Portunus trituberculatus TaxID=210409 RepID=A0A5B7IYX0_PORTR|nr:putative RNA-binding protein 23 [Portunus trituberculatus]